MVYDMYYWNLKRRRERDQDKGIFEEIKAEHFPKVMNNNKLKILEAQRTSSRSRKKNLGTSYSHCWKLKIKRESWRQPEEKWHITYRGTRVRITADVLSEAMWVRRQLSNIFKVLKEKNKSAQREKCSELKEK